MFIATLPASPAWAAPLPEATPPPGRAVYQLPTGTYETRAAFAVRGGSFRDKRHFAATAVLVRHPQGDFLIDAGFGAGVASHDWLRGRFRLGAVRPEVRLHRRPDLAARRIRRRVERPWLLRKLADSDPGQVRQGLLCVIALADLMQVVPAHDRDAYDGIPRLPARLTPVPAPGAAGQPR